MSLEPPALAAARDRAALSSDLAAELRHSYGTIN